MNTNIIIGKNAKWIINGDTEINGACINLWPNAFFETSELKINCLTKINIRKKVIFGNNILIARSCYISDTNSHHIFKNGKEKESTGSLTIGDNVWICTNCVLLKNTSIGSNTVISCNSVISDKIDSNQIAGNIKNNFSSEIDYWAK